MARPRTSPSRADDLAHELQVEILTGRIPLGTRLRQEDLAARFGVSRTPIREALRQLQAIGLVEQLGHRGALVKSFEPDECRNIFLVRAELEGLAAERAAGRLTNYDNADLAAAQALLRAGAERHKSLPESAQEERRITLEQCSQANELYHNVILAAANCRRCATPCSRSPTRCRGRSPGTRSPTTRGSCREARAVTTGSPRRSTHRTSGGRGGCCRST